MVPGLGSRSGHATARCRLELRRKRRVRGENDKCEGDSDREVHGDEVALDDLRM